MEAAYLDSLEWELGGGGVLISVLVGQGFGEKLQFEGVF